MELTKAQRKRFASLSTNKGRRELGLFTAEGTKCVLEAVGAFEVDTILTTADWLAEHSEALPTGAPVTEVRRADLIEISSLSTPPDVIAVYRIPDNNFSAPKPSELSIALDRIQDPGNLGTIIRIASWMGISDVYCSTDTVDVYNPKVVQATMGAIARVRVHYVDLPALLADATSCGTAVYGTFLDGKDIYETPLTPGGIVVMGNEGNGISEAVSRHIDRRLFIPSYPPGQPAIESLNVSVATAITIAEFRRRQYNH
ncbi:MAG: RNA methyltransferase [Muribaculaceae bacterium]|nr:RNA methyltransferase [Muribaculaceae bacterium]